MAVSDDRKFTSAKVSEILKGVLGKTLGEVDSSGQFSRTETNPKITGIAGDIIEQSVFKFARDAKQECDIEIDGQLVELKTTGVRIQQNDLKKLKALFPEIEKNREEYNKHLGAKEGISITAVTFNPIQTDFDTSHFWEKLERLLIVFYEYNSYKVVPASEYRDFLIVGHCYNTFSETEKKQLQSDWEIVRDYLQKYNREYPSYPDMMSHLVGFTHVLRPDLLLIELVPGLKKREGSDSYQKPRYRLKKTFVDYIVRGHFNLLRKRQEIDLEESFDSFKQLDERCHALTQKYKGLTLQQFKDAFSIETPIKTKDFAAKCVLKMFDADCKRLNQISDFNRAGIIAKTIRITPTGDRTEDMKLKSIDFDEWLDPNVEFENSDFYTYFCEHSFLCPIFCEHDSDKPELTTFEGFKRFSFDDDFINNEVKRTWDEARRLILDKKLKWVYVYKNGKRIKNKSGSYKGAPNLPKSADYIIFFRGGADDSRKESRTENVNGIKMLPQFIWLKGSYVTNRLKNINYL